MLATNRILRVPRSFIARGCLVSLVAFLVIAAAEVAHPVRLLARTSVDCKSSTISMTVEPSVRQY